MLWMEREELLPDQLEIVDQAEELSVPLLLIRLAQHRRRMHREKDQYSQLTVVEFAALRCEAHGSFQDRLSGNDAQTDHDAGVDRLDLRGQPGPAGRNFRGRRALMLAPFPLRIPFKMLDGIGDIDLVTGNVRFYQSSIQKFSRRSHERMSGAVFQIARLLSDQHQRGTG